MSHAALGSNTGCTGRADFIASLERIRRFHSEAAPPMRRLVKHCQPAEPRSARGLFETALSIEPEYQWLLNLAVIPRQTAPSDPPVRSRS